MTDDGPSVVAAFDLDGTLTDGGSVFKWLQHVAGTSRTWRAASRLILPLTLGALRSGPSADRAKERLFRALLAGREWAGVDNRVKKFSQSIGAKEVA